jgi:hypothetical protein
MDTFCGLPVGIVYMTGDGQGIAKLGPATADGADPVKSGILDSRRRIAPMMRRKDPGLVLAKVEIGGRWFPQDDA